MGIKAMATVGQTQVNSGGNPSKLQWFVKLFQDCFKEPGAEISIDQKCTIDLASLGHFWDHPKTHH